MAASRDGGVWIAERRALLRLTAAGFSSHGASQGLPGANPTSLFEDSRGRLWLGVDSSLAWWEHGRFFRLTVPDGSVLGVVREIVEDRDGSLLAITTQPGHALIRIRGDRVVEVLSGERFGAQQVSAMAAEPKGGVWIGLINSQLKLYRDGRLEPHGSVGEPGRVRIRGLLPDARGLWVMTDRGLSLLRNGRLSTLDARNGLPCEDIEAILPSGDGSLWVKTACGLIQIPPGELASWLDHPERRLQVRVLDAFDGAQAGLSPFTPRAAKSLDGRLWFALEEGGLQVFDPRGVKSNAIPPPVQILRAVADRRLYEPESRLRLPPLTKDLKTTRPSASPCREKVRFRYRLRGERTMPGRRPERAARPSIPI